MNYFCMERPSVFRVARTKDVACRGFALRAGAAIDAVMHPCAPPLHSRAIAPPMATIRGEEATLDGVGIGGGGGGGGGGGARVRRRRLLGRFRPRRRRERRRGGAPEAPPRQRGGPARARRREGRGADGEGEAEGGGATRRAREDRGVGARGGRFRRVRRRVSGASYYHTCSHMTPSAW